MTAEELLRYRHEPYRQELIGGRLYEMEPTGAEHGVVEGKIYALLTRHVEATNLGTTFVGDVGFQIAADPDTVRAPDVAFVARARVDVTGIPRGFWPGAPDLAVEVVSPDDRHSDVEGKALDWVDAGARAVVVVDPPRRTATVYRARHDIRVLTADEPLDLGDVVAGWSPRVGAFFA
jgi:Uma2 family endonuclease